MDILFVSDHLTGGRAALTLVLLVLSNAASIGWADDSVPFEKLVAPLLTTRCSGCHNPSDLKGGLDLTSREKLLAGGDSGAVLVPEKVEESLLWDRIASQEMPPKQPLADAEREIIKNWIRQGAPWSGGALDPFRYTTSKRAGYDWWSLQPLKRDFRFDQGAIEAARSSNPIDLFIGEKLRAAHLSQSPVADRRTLIRRLYFDLVGLPPDPEAIAEFEQDISPMFYERLVDRLLASPAYGERWARHWLDVIRFGESQGFERDKLRTNAWRYRDWVISAWNEDLPYDEFARRQLAGDVLQPGDRAALIATGFLVAGPYDEVGQKQQSAAMRAVVREDELEDLIGTVSQTFLGLTVNCSRCHDHKFDPIRQTEYYRLSAALAGVKHGEPELSGVAPLTDAALALEVRSRARQLEKRLAALEAPYRDRILAEWQARRAKLMPPNAFAAWEFDEDARDSIGDLQGELHAGAKIAKGVLVLDGKGFVLTSPLPKDLLEKTLEAWVTIQDLAQQGGGVIGVQTLKGDIFDSLVYGEREPRRWLPGSNSYERTKSFQGPEEAATITTPLHVAIVYRADGTVIGYRNGSRYGSEFQSNGPVTFSASKSQITIGLRHSPPGDNRLFRGTIDRARLYDRALSDDEVAASAGAAGPIVSEEALTAAMSAENRQARTDLQFEIEQLRQHDSRISDRKVYAIASAAPDPTFVLVRGNPSQRGDLVTPGAIAALRSLNGDFALPADASDADRRRRLADWVCTQQNPLFARVIVNRLWQYHFGVGIVETPNDFGFNGGRPSHPELLDWMAAEFIRGGWSIKHMQRLLVTSATYRQASRVRPDAQSADVGNRWLWRKSPLRLDAETLRDSLLALAGNLNRTMHGPGYYDFSTYVSNSQFYALRDPDGPTFARRSIYRTWVRSGRNPFLDVFDCPDPSTKTPQRAVTTTPLQALSLLNNGMVLRMADRFAERVNREAGNDPALQIRRVFDLAYGRQPDSQEQQVCSTLVREHGLGELCRVIYNSNEMLYVD